MLLKFHGKNFLLRLLETSSINFGLKADLDTQGKKQTLALTRASLKRFQLDENPESYLAKHIIKENLTIN